MKVILTKEVLGLGDPGEVVDVKRGYARNYLMPQGIAMEATRKNVAQLEDQRRRLEASMAAEAAKVRESASAIDGVSVNITARAGEAGRLYGSVTNREIADALAELGHEVDRRRIVMDEGPIKSLGEHPIKIKLHPQVVVEISVMVEAMASEEAKALAEAEGEAEAAPEDELAAAEEQAEEEAPEDEAEAEPEE